MTTTTHHIVIVGGGAGGLELATQLGDTLGKRRKADVTLVDAALTHLWKPLLHEVAAGTLNSSEDELNYLSHARSHHFRFRIGALEALDRSRKQVSLAATLDEAGQEIVPARTFGYDTLIIAIGGATNDFGIPGVREHCLLIDSRPQAERLHKHLLRHFYRVSAQSAEAPAGQLDIAIAGGGATGVELAAELTEAVRELATHGLERPGPQQRVNITVIEGAERLLAALPEKVSARTETTLRDIGVAVVLGEMIAEATAEGFYTQSGQFIRAATKVWAAGIQAPACLRALDGLEVNGNAQLKVGANLQTSRDEDIFAFGDCADCSWKGRDQSVPPRAQAAHQQAAHLVDTMHRRLAGKSPRDFLYRDHGSLVSLSRFGTVGNLMGNLRGKTSRALMIEGWLARLAYRMLYKMHLLALHGLRWVILLTLARWLTRKARPLLKLH